MGNRVGPKLAYVEIFQKYTHVHVRLPIKIPKNHPLGFWIHPTDSQVRGQPGVSQGHLEVPWECQIGPKLKFYVKIIYSEHFWFLEFFWLFMIFGTLFSRKCPFLSNFDKNLFLPQSSTHMNKICSKFNLELTLGHFLSICVDDWGKNRFLSKLPKNGHFSLNKVPKIINNQKNSKIRKCSEYMIFTQIFNFGSKSYSQGSSRWAGSPGSWNGLSSREVEARVNLTIPGMSFQVLATTEIGWFLIF